LNSRRINQPSIQLDHLRIASPGEGTDVIVANRLPPPVIPPWAEAITATTFSVVAGQQIKLSTPLNSGVNAYVVTFGSTESLTPAQAQVIISAVVAPELSVVVNYEGNGVRVTGSGWLLIEEPAPTGASSDWIPSFGFPSETINEVVASVTSSTPLEMDIFDTGTSGLLTTRVTVQIDSESPLEIYPAIPVGWTVTATDTASPGSSSNDSRHILAEHTSPFPSGSQITVRVYASTNAKPTEAIFESTFGVLDDLAPSIVWVKPWGSRRLLVKFSEPMLCDSDNPRSAIFTKSISGRVQYHRNYQDDLVTYANVIEAPIAEFETNAHEDMFIGSRKANNSENDGAFSIIAILSASLARLDGRLSDEEVADLTADEIPPDVYLTPYRVRRNPPLDEIKPIFEPHVVLARTPAVGTVAIGNDESLEQFVELFLDDDLTFDAAYFLDVRRLEDLSGNPCTTSASFSSVPYASIAPSRDFSIWNMMPQYNKDRDASRDMERLVKCFDECLQIMFYEVDNFLYLYDPYRVKEELLDVFLVHLGNPFKFAQGLDAHKKRDLIALLVQMYKTKGTADGLTAMILFFLGKRVTVEAAETDTDTWSLGDSFLGSTTVLGPSADAIRYSFKIGYNSSFGVTLSDADKVIIEEIIEHFKPAHTHFLGYIDTSD
jgi:phage tail-like protein